MGIFGNLFSKQACEICDKEVGALSRVKLKDNKYICRDCDKKELFSYDQIDSFGPYTEMNSMNRSEGEKAIKEYGVLIKMRCAEGFTKVKASATASMVLGGPATPMIPSGSFSDADRAKWTKLADEIEKRAVGQPLREMTIPNSPTPT